jgi:hypothetical protein
MPVSLAIVAGKDEYLVERDARALYNQAVQKAGPEADKEIISGLINRVDDAQGIEIQFLESVNTLSMFGGAKVVWLRNINWIADNVPSRSDEVKLAMAQPRDVDVVVALLALHRRTPSAVFFVVNATACRLVEYIGNRHRKRCRAVVAMTAPNNILQRRLVCEDDVTEQDALFEAWVGIFGRVLAQAKVLNHQLVHLLARQLCKCKLGDVYEDVFVESE